MEDARWERIAAIVGMALFIVLTVAAGLVQGDAPDLDDPPRQWARYVADHTDEIKISALLGMAAFGPLFLWLGSLWRTLRRAEGEPRLTVVAAVGLTVTAALVGAGFAVFAVTASRQDALDPAGVQLFATLGISMQAAANFGAATLVGATSLLAWRTGVFARWFALAGAALTVALLVGSVAMVSLSDTFSVIFDTVFVVLLLWLIGATVFMAMRRPATAGTPAGS